MQTSSSPSCSPRSVHTSPRCKAQGAQRRTLVSRELVCVRLGQRQGYLTPMKLQQHPSLACTTPAAASVCRAGRACVQAEDIARQAPELLDRLPRALRRAVELNKVPGDLERDVLALADWVEPLIPQLKERISQAPAQAQALADRAQPAVKQATQVRPGAGWQSQCECGCQQTLACLGGAACARPGAGAGRPDPARCPAGRAGGTMCWLAQCSIWARQGLELPGAKP